MRRSKRLTVVNAAWLAFCLLCLLLVAIPAFAAPNSLTLCDVCAWYMISKRGDDVFIKCPDGSTFITLKGCRNPVAKRAANKVTINCNWT